MYIDDIPIKGPQSYYLNSDGTYETIPENAGIQRFMWEHFQGINLVFGSLVMKLEKDHNQTRL